MTDIWWRLGLVAALILLNAGFAATEVALISLRESQLARLHRKGGAGAVAARLGRDPTRFLATVQVGITLAGFLASAVAATSLAEPLVPALRPLGSWAELVAIGGVTVILSFVTLVLGELVPKRLAMQRAEAWASLAARPLVFTGWVTAPAVWLVSVTTDLVVRLLGGKPGRGREVISEEEIRDLIAIGASGPAQRSILLGALDVSERRLRHVLVPRRDVVALALTTPAADAVERLVHVTHSRAPVYGRDLDDVRGIVHLGDLIGRRDTVGNHLRPALMLPESLTVLGALRRMQDRREQMAVVLDEYGGTEGIVTIEDLLEEVVGEIHDEFDTDQRAVERAGDGSLVAYGGLAIHDLADLSVVLPEGAYTTVAGLVLARLGRVAVTGDTVEVGGWRIEVLDAGDSAIRQVRLAPTRRVPSPGPPEPE